MTIGVPEPQRCEGQNDGDEIILGSGNGSRIRSAYRLVGHGGWVTDTGEQLNQERDEWDRQQLGADKESLAQIFNGMYEHYKANK